ncbi:Bax inhibitor-1/YccA family protein [Streptococcus sp. X16XC17]|uniref:Bax inhibitor-1/YccA family protein n=1 Tax=unclassified Streptococcus TaxID=2608887 RepID=UPI00066FB97D|nr:MULTISPECIES: Bax inhibitor-1/YccA family protein [unclassified Streptococcus]TCD46042.1 Bax inhibitor-1/YccA family protein [Streptococcus sp. X16XC17]
MNDNPFVINQTDVGALNRFFARIYGFVAAGIVLSALTALLSLTVFQDVTISILRGGSMVLMILMLVELILVFAASGMAAKNSPMALPMFLLYSVLNGFTLSFVLLFYTQATVFNAFISSALMFAVMAVIGATTKKDLSAMGQALRAALIGIIIASVVNIFLGSSGMSFIISIISVVIFAGLIAYDNQRIRYVFEQTGGQVGQGWVVSLALQLYLDFINLFLNLLRIFGSRD